MDDLIQMNATPGQPPGHSRSFSLRNHSCMHWKWPSCPHGSKTMVSFFKGLSHRTQSEFLFLQESQYQYPNLSIIFLLFACCASALNLSLELSFVINSPHCSQYSLMEDWSISLMCIARISSVYFFSHVNASKLDGNHLTRELWNSSFLPLDGLLYVHIYTYCSTTHH